MKTKLLGRAEQRVRNDWSFIASEESNLGSQDKEIPSSTHRTPGGGGRDLLFKLIKGKSDIFLLLLHSVPAGVYLSELFLVFIFSHFFSHLHPQSGVFLNFLCR